jgi:hypothetical protein
MQIGEKCIQCLLVNMLFEKIINTKIWKDTFLFLFTWEWVNKFWFGIVQFMTAWGI